MSIKSFFKSDFLTDWILAEDSNLYFLITSFLLKPLLTPLARAFRKFSWNSVSCSTSR